MAFGVSLKSAWGVDCFEECAQKPPSALPATPPPKPIKDNKRSYELPSNEHLQERCIELSVSQEKPMPGGFGGFRGRSFQPDDESKKLFFVIGLGLLVIVMMDIMVKLGFLLG